MALPTGKSLPHFLPHSLPTSVSRKLTDYPFIGRLILNSINMGRKLHFLVSIIDKKDTLIYKAQRKGPSVCPGRPLGRKDTCPSLSVCLPFYQKPLSWGFLTLSLALAAEHLQP